jgi:hypothetical protein
MRILLHICCGPCAIGVVRYLRKEIFPDVVGFFYNPNIHPKREYLRRKESLQIYAGVDNLEVIYPEYNPKDFFKLISINEKQPERCKKCWYLRLKATVFYAKENKFDYFTSTLLVSPHQDLNLIRKVGERAAEENGVKFHYQNFRFLFSDARRVAKELNLYRQNYCGCIMSKREREERIKEKQNA